MSMFCWTGAKSSELCEEEHQRAKMFESTFTYNTERNYNNNYINWTRGNNYAYYNDDDRLLDDLKPTSVIEFIFVALSFVLFVCTLPFSLFFTLKFVGGSERLIVLRLGKAQRVRGPGLVLVFPCIDKTAKVDIRITSYDLPNIHIITTDKGIVEFSASVFSQVIDPLTSYCNILDKDATIRNLAYTALYKHLTKKTLYDITHPPYLSKILKNIQDELNGFTLDMGIELLEVTVTKINIIKESEDQTMALFHTLAKSEVGNTIIQQLQSQFIQHISFSETNAKAQSETKVTDPPERQCSPTEFVSDKDLEELLMKIRLCCDESLVAKVGKCYRIVCEDEKGTAAVLLVNLKQDAGSATWTSLKADCNVDVDVTFSLSKKCLFALIAGEVSPFSAYMNGSVRISGSVADANGLQHLMDRAKELKCI